MKDNGEVIPDDRFQVLVEDLGNTKLVIRNVQLSDAGVYFCVAENAKGKVKCAATLRVNGQYKLTSREVYGHSYIWGL